MEMNGTSAILTGHLVRMASYRASYCAESSPHIAISEHVNQDDHSDHNTNHTNRDSSSGEAEYPIEDHQNFKDHRRPVSPGLQTPQSPGEDNFQNAHD